MSQASPNSIRKQNNNSSMSPVKGNMTHNGGQSVMTPATNNNYKSSKISTFHFIWPFRWKRQLKLQWRCSLSVVVVHGWWNGWSFTGYHSDAIQRCIWLWSKQKCIFTNGCKHWIPKPYLETAIAATSNLISEPRQQNHHAPRGSKRSNEEKPECCNHVKPLESIIAQPKSLVTVEIRTIYWNCCKRPAAKTSCK